MDLNALTKKDFYQAVYHKQTEMPWENPPDIGNHVLHEKVKNTIIQFLSTMLNLIFSNLSFS